jgi:hypothetical protein
LIQRSSQDKVPTEWKPQLGDTFRKHLKDLNCEISPGHVLLVLAAVENETVNREKVRAPQGHYAALLQSSFTDESFASFFEYMKKISIRSTSQIVTTDDGPLDSPSSLIVSRVADGKDKAPVRSPSAVDGQVEHRRKRKAPNVKRRKGRKRQKLQAGSAEGSSSAGGPGDEL